MKQLLKQSINILLVIGIVTMFIGCEKGPNFKVYTYPAPTVAGIGSSSDYPNSYVTITGKNFGVLTGAVTVYFGGIKADSVISCTDNQVVVKVPAGAISGKVTFKIWTNTIDSIGKFTVLPAPSISSVSLGGVSLADGALLNPGDVLNVKGINFGSNVSVLFGSTVANVQLISNGEMNVTVPQTISGNLKLAFGTQVVNGIYCIIGATKLTGTIIGHSGSYGNNAATTITAAFDGNINTFVDGPTATGYAGYDLGSSNTAKVVAFRFYPRSNYASRMVGGQLRGSNDPTLATYDVLYNITAAPSATAYTTVTITSTKTYRYIYYYSAAGFCNVAELVFYGQ